ncbi:uncharacterized protein LOC131434155 [Malaya genurostris]|uniref:uncharacterized protein LOC131434155 n=1 Tax=Malaya genurostris TaxID=325434 RepID=UPI0026F3FAFB|nr:uncharacterized protein LOC131434155 [Malaya genurostris]
MAEDPESRRLMLRRTALLAALDRAGQFLAAYQDDRDRLEVALRIENLDTIWQELDDIQSDLECTEETDEGMSLNQEIRSKYESDYFKIKAGMLSKLPPTIPSTSISHPSPPTVSSSLKGLKLPTISLPEFDGDFKEWLTFHDTFLALIHSNQDVPAIQKFHYLKSAVTGEAAQMIESFAISAANYPLAWQALISRYANEYLLKKRHMQALLEIQRVKKETTAALHGIVDDFERHTKILRQLGEPVDTWSTMLEHLLCVRLPDDSLKAWEDHASTIENPSYQALIEFLHRRIRVLESISVNHAQPLQQYATSSHVSAHKLSNVKSSSNSALNVPPNKCYACEQRHPKRHHSLLHSGFEENPDPFTRNSSSLGKLPCLTTNVNLATSSESSSSPILSAATSLQAADINCSLPVQKIEKNVFMLTAVVSVVDRYGQNHLVRALLDCASQPNLVSERMAQLLRLKRTKANVLIQGIGGQPQNAKELVNIKVHSRKEEFSLDVEFLILPKVTPEIIARNVSIDHWKLPPNIFLADPQFHRRAPIDMILGIEHFFSFFNTAKRINLHESRSMLIDSVFGWLVSGSNSIVTPAEQNHLCHIVTVSLLTLEQSIERFWQVEELQTQSNYSENEKLCEEMYVNTTTRTTEGRYMVRLPRRTNFNEMVGSSKPVAINRYQLLEKRLSRNPELKEDYHRFMSEYLSLGHMQCIREDDRLNSYSYLPHHPVVKESSTTTKTRVVFDASVKTSTGFSLNEALLVGPVVQDDLLSIILRFRTFPVALVGDIAKMYRQILLHPDDTCYQRILWRFRPTDSIESYELKTVTYGLSPSSFLATRTLQQLATDEGDKFPIGKVALQRCFYVDDFIGGAQSVAEAIQLRTELSELLAEGGFALRKWTSNKLQVLSGLSQDEIGTQTSIKFDTNEMVKPLGISWEPESDSLRFDSRIHQHKEVPTKRSILSAISQLFDPLGLISPIIVKGKILTQHLWLLPCSWDDEVPDHIANSWTNLAAELPKLANFHVSRYALLQSSSVQLHTFCDASESAYGACAYARCVNSVGQVRVQLLASKSRVAPLKKITLPRLELCATEVGAKLHAKIYKALQVPVTGSYFWSDSTVALQWLRAPPSTWKTFVANRFSEIQSLTHGAFWNHVKGTDNPADLVTRGMDVDEFLSNRAWTNGPDWLSYPETEWSVSKLPEYPKDGKERRKMIVAVTKMKVMSISVNPIFARFSSYERMLRSTAYVLRFIANSRNKARTQSSSFVGPISSIRLTVNDLNAADRMLVQLAQEDAFHDEINPEGTIRVGGRLRLSNQPFLTKHPALLPSNHPLSRLIAKSYHLKLIHGGGRLTLAAMREKYWPLQGRRLPNKLDNFLYIESHPADRSPYQEWIMRAVHIELASDLSTQAFLSALRRFIARRGRPTDIYSDNGKNFEGAANELGEVYRMLQNDVVINQITSDSTCERITWHFSPPKAPHFGGLWEAAVKVAKRQLYRQLGNSKLSFEDMATILTQIEASMNSRPIVPLSEDPNDVAAITPAHFLIGGTMHSLPEPNLFRISLNRLDHYQRLQRTYQQFWHHWRTEYLQELQKDTKTCNPNTDIQPGRLVVLIDELQIPVKWPLARIVAIHPGKDKLVRVVSLRTSRGVITRPVTKICLLPTEESQNAISTKDSSVTNSSTARLDDHE